MIEQEYDGPCVDCGNSFPGDDHKCPSDSLPVKGMRLTPEREQELRIQVNEDYYQDYVCITGREAKELLAEIDALRAETTMLRDAFEKEHNYRYGFLDNCIKWRKRNDY